MRIEDGTAATLREFFGHVPRGRYWVAIDGERVVAAAGYKFDQGRVHVFASLTDEIRRYPIKMVRCGRKIMEEACSKGMPVHVLADQSVPRSREFLLHLGFEEQ
jgi:hypothetical protein